MDFANFWFQAAGGDPPSDLIGSTHFRHGVSADIGGADVGKPTYTFSLWFKPVSFDGDDRILNFVDYAGGYDQFMMGYTQGGGIGIGFWNGGGGTAPPPASILPLSSKWYHVCGQCQTGNTGWMCINGIKYTSFMGGEADGWWRINGSGKYGGAAMAEFYMAQLILVAQNTELTEKDFGVDRGGTWSSRSFADIDARVKKTTAGWGNGSFAFSLDKFAGFTTDLSPRGKNITGTGITAGDISSDKPP